MLVIVYPIAILSDLAWLIDLHAALCNAIHASSSRYSSSPVSVQNHTSQELLQMVHTKGRKFATIGSSSVFDHRRDAQSRR